MADDRSTAEQLFSGKGEMAARMRSIDWSQSLLGAVENWSQSLRSALSICLNSRFPIAIYWGQDCLLLYNDAWRPIVGDKHSWAIGRPAREVWSEIWDDIGSELAGVLATGEGTFHKDDLLSMNRFGYTEECFFEYTFNPIQGQGGIVDGVMNIVSETTYRVLTDRRAQLLREVAAKTGIARTVEASCDLTVEALKSDPFDIPFALLYLVDPDGTARLCSGSDRAFRSVSPAAIDLAVDDADGWSIALAARTAQPQVINNLVSRFGILPGSPWAEPPGEAMVLPIAGAGLGKVSGVLFAVASPRRKLDDNYRDFFIQVAGQIALTIANARSYEEERQRAEQLAELNRAKTVFFSNVSHEFRTPLTLMLSPLEELSNKLENRLQPSEREQLQLVQRNGLRLQKLVNTLLDFSRIEAGRVQASYEPIDLATYTAELASVFRSLIERAGLDFVIDCPRLPEPVYVDRDLWEKIIFNLLSNAFKFTFTGSITVRLGSVDNCVELSVADTGVGISEAELPRLFERFHRIPSSRARTHEGSGIGLAFVQELVKLHGGTVRVTSQIDRGTTFTIAIPFGTAHLPPTQIQSARTLEPTALGAAPFIEEALRWTIERGEDVEETVSPLPISASFTPLASARILLADDNADMRDYVKRLLSSRFEVEAVSNGFAALKAVQTNAPDLVLTDVMMPEMDGFELLRRLRSNPITQEIPIILLSARAGEESRIEGLEIGADDYLTKPFSARELIARVEASLKLSQLRQETAQREQVLRQQAEAAQQQIENILSSINDGFYVLDRHWQFTYVNDRYCEMVEMPASAILGQNIWTLFPPVVDTEAEVQFHRAMREQMPLQFDYHYTSWNCWYDYRIYPSPDGLTVFLADITDRKQTESDRAKLLAQEQAAREAAERANQIKDEFLAVLSHELRSPLNPILGWSKLLQRGNLDAAKTQIALETIERNAQLQAQLIGDLLDISRILRGKLILEVMPVELATVISAALETVYLSAKAKSVQIHTAASSPDISVDGDAGRLQQVVWNLLSNAVKFTPAGGQVTVALTQTDTHAQMQVTDTGKGINPDFIPYVFEHFRQEDGATTRKFGGLGLGLAIVRQLVEMHGGTVKAESAGEGQGARFTVQIPLSARSGGVQALAAPALISLDGLQILVVDDEADSREFVAFVLEQAGAIVTRLSAGIAALQEVERFPFDVIVSDIAMPEMDGYMLMQQIRALKHNSKVPAVALTAYAGEVDQQQAAQAGFQRHLSKPIEPNELIQTIAHLTGRSRHD